MPDIYEGAIRIGESFGTDSYNDTLVKEFTAFRSESIDFGIMEKAENIYTIPGSFGWDDVGSWLAVERINQTDDLKNYFEGDVVAVDSKRTTVCGGKRLIAAIGTRDVIIVDTDDVLLVCSKNNTQDVKKAIAQLKEQGRTELI
jgi:mannose-1-phosphate guanylyltransferase